MKTKFDSAFDPVVLRNIITGERSAEVKILLDTGADISLIPAAVADSVGIDTAAGKDFELIGFDGTVSLFPTVKAQVIFLEKRFSGQYCVVETEDMAVLGRDVLNQLAITFDGPNLEWIEMSASSTPDIIS